MTFPKKGEGKENGGKGGRKKKGLGRNFEISTHTQYLPSRTGFVEHESISREKEREGREIFELGTFREIAWVGRGGIVLGGRKLNESSCGVPYVEGCKIQRRGYVLQSLYHIVSHIFF